MEPYVLWKLGFHLGLSTILTLFALATLVPAKDTYLAKTKQHLPWLVDSYSFIGFLSCVALANKVSA